MDNLDHAVFTNPSPQLAYFIGLFAADGCVFKCKTDSGYKHRLVLQERDRKVLDDIRDWMSASAQVRPLLCSGRRYVQFQFRSVWLATYLESIGIGPGKSTTLGSIVIPCRFEREFVRGFIDGDGCWSYMRNKPFLQVLGPKGFLLWFSGIIRIGCGAEPSGIYRHTVSGSISRLQYARSSEFHKVRKWLEGTVGILRKDPLLYANDRKTGTSV